jgi:hypothetical protein
MTMKLQGKSGHKLTRPQNPALFIGLVILVFLLAGLQLVPQYSQSTDEPPRRDYASRSLSAYSGVATDLQDEKGPFYGMAALVGSAALQQLFPAWGAIDAWHFMTYLSFLVGIYFLYRLCRRLFDPSPALVAILLFATQPVIWGHAFINPKDIPFMAFFLASVSLGLEMVDRFAPRPGQNEPVAPPAELQAAAFGGFAALACWQAAPRRLRRLLTGLGAAWVGLLVLFPMAQAGIAWIVNQAYSAPPSSELGQLFTRAAQNASLISAAAYIHKAQTIGIWLAGAAWIGLSLAAGLTAWRIFALQGSRLWTDLTQTLRQTSPFLRSLIAGLSAFWRSLAGDWKSAARRWQLLLIVLLVMTGLAITYDLRQPATMVNIDPSPLVRYAAAGEMALMLLILGAAGRVFPSVVGQPLRYLAQTRLLLAACFLGFCSAIRTLGPASGLLVAVYFLFRSGRKALPALLAYLAGGSLVTILFWPYLWNAPISHFLAALSQAAEFGWNETLIFSGQLLPESWIPSTYLPTMLSLQFTEIAMGLVLVGTVLGLIVLWKKPGLRLDLLLLGTWFVAPVAATMLHHTTLYNSFRQFLFIIPPLFILAGLALQTVWRLLKQINRGILFWLLAFVILLPGLIWNIDLHPYEYTYFNGLAGGVQGAFRYFEIDYWDTSFKEDVQFLNKVAPLNAIILVQGGVPIIPKSYARPDLRIITAPLPDDATIQVDYAIITTERFEDLTYFPNSKIIFQVTRDQAVLSVVKQVLPGDPLRP